MKQIKIMCGDIELKAELNDKPTAKKIYGILPVNSRAMRWGAEVYFTIPMDAELEADARDILEPGELGFWPVGNAFCIFWGPTPASNADEPRAASHVNVFGHIIGDASILEKAVSGTKIRVEAL